MSASKILYRTCSFEEAHYLFANRRTGRKSWWSTDINYCGMILFSENFRNKKCKPDRFTQLVMAEVNTANPLLVNRGLCEVRHLCLRAQTPLASLILLDQYEFSLMEYVLAYKDKIVRIYYKKEMANYPNYNLIDTRRVSKLWHTD